MQYGYMYVFVFTYIYIHIQYHLYIYKYYNHPEVHRIWNVQQYVHFRYFV